MTSNGHAVHPTRADRQSEAPSARNAQGMFPPDACLFVGNISSGKSKEQQENDLKEMFSTYGPCYPKVKIDKNKGLPGAFVQFEKVEDAINALELNGKTLHERPLRIERAKGQRTACLFNRSGASLTEDTGRDILEGHGALQGLCLDECTLPGHNDKTTVCIVTFAFVEDYNDAVKNFQKDSQYCLQKTKHEGNPFADGGNPKLDCQPGESRAAHVNGNGFHRSGPSNYRGNGRGGFRSHHHPFQRGSHRSSPARDYPPQYFLEEYRYHGGEPQYPNSEPPVPQPFVPVSTHPHDGTRLTGEAPPFIPSQNGGYHGPQAPETSYHHPPVNGYSGESYNYNGPSMGLRRHDPGYRPGPRVYEGPLIVNGHREPNNSRPLPNDHPPPYMIPNGRIDEPFYPPMEYDPRYPPGQYPGQYPRPYQDPYHQEPIYHGQYTQGPYLNGNYPPGPYQQGPYPYGPPYQQGPENFMPGPNGPYPPPYMNPPYQQVQPPVLRARPFNTNSISVKVNHTETDSPSNTQHETSPDPDSEQETLVNESDETQSADENDSDTGSQTDANTVIFIKDREEQEADSSSVKSDDSDITVTRSPVNGHLHEAAKEHHTNGVELGEKLGERRLTDNKSCPALLRSTPSLESTPTQNDVSLTSSGRSIADLVREANIERGLNCDDNTLEEVTRYFEQEEEERRAHSKG
ncbi:hypothetical protein PENSTE_c002G05476 [Penicillium steckii]|uniref:RRM domain-containing protein n=1 Tax=Penicillium steckii TaxID=303698 RepID=A0A1V6TU14_9EURO|nr:hypothetical protein PENSTE_c002G05476 [Penicillium steckii]